MNNNGRGKILIMDDSVNLLRMLYRLLKNEGLEVISASTLEEAEYAIQNAIFDLIIADVRMTGIYGREGFELMEYVKEFSPATKVIIMTGYGSSEIEREAYKNGAFFYFEKPIEIKVLTEKIQEINIFGKALPKGLNDE